jgi:hypothetical protein
VVLAQALYRARGGAAARLAGGHGGQAPRPLLLDPGGRSGFGGGQRSWRLQANGLVQGPEHLAEDHLVECGGATTRRGGR